MNFDLQIITLFKETLDLVENNKGIEWLVAEYRNESQSMITKGMIIHWDHFVNQYDTSRYDKTNSVIDLYKNILHAIEDLATCSYMTKAFLELLGKVQAAVSLMSCYANLDHWVAELDNRIETILLQQLLHIIQVWCAEFNRIDKDTHCDTLPLQDITNKRWGDKYEGGKGMLHSSLLMMFLEGHIMLKPIVHESQIQNQVIFLDPPIQSLRYEIWLQMEGANIAETTYTLLLTQFPDNMLQCPFSLIELKVQQLKDYIAKWLQFQSLWDLKAEYVFNHLSDSLANWQQLLMEIKKAQSMFDTSDMQKSFGVCYDSWQRDILSQFRVKLGNTMKEMHASILKARMMPLSTILTTYWRRQQNS
ncbi:hypothetical protein L208DRAFT_1559573 [Tricholoma matsutake]|nr:hypothetical protein L208DRAFT_1559573 [Tricholoma matsutake 945]